MANKYIHNDGSESGTDVHHEYSGHVWFFHIMG